MLVLLKSINFRPSHLIFIISLLIVIGFAYGLAIHNVAHIGNTVAEYQSDDTETNYLAALSVYRGEGLYQSVSIVYPPGRFFAISGLFHIMGASVPTMGFYFNFFVPFLYPIALYIFSYQVYTRYISQRFGFLLALIPLVIDLSFIRSAQEIHVISLLFFTLLLAPLPSQTLKHLALGILFGLLPLFRIEAAVITTLALGITHISLRKLPKLPLYSIIGLSLVWIPAALYILLYDSWYYFLHDTLYLGLIVQPSVMSHAIQIDHIPLFTALLVFILSSGLALSISTVNNKIKAFAVFSVLSFATALSRSDEGHVWYASIWMSFYIGWLVIVIKDIKKFLTVSTFLTIALYAFIVILIGMLLIYIKSPGVFVLAVLALFSWALYTMHKSQGVIIQVSGLLAALVLFHSISYVSLRYVPLSYVYAFTFMLPSYEEGLFRDDDHEIAGFIFPPEYMKVLAQIQSQIPSNERSLFIFPDHALYYEYFKQTNPTRYYYLTGERTTRTENHLIAQLQQSNTRYFVIFPKAAQVRGGQTWQWIQNNTEIIDRLTLGPDEVELRRRLATQSI